MTRNAQRVARHRAKQRIELARLICGWMRGGLSSGDLHTLALIEIHGPVTTGYLAQRMQVTRQAVGQWVKRLNRRELIRVVKLNTETRKNLTHYTT